MCCVRSERAWEVEAPGDEVALGPRCGAEWKTEIEKGGWHKQSRRHPHQAEDKVRDGSNAPTDRRKNLSA